MSVPHDGGKGVSEYEMEGMVSTSIGLANLLMDTLDLDRDAELAEAR